MASNEAARKRFEARLPATFKSNPLESSRVKFRTVEDLYAAVRTLIEQECELKILRHGEDHPSKINMEVFGCLPFDVLNRMQHLADACSLFLGQDAAEDHFPTHPDRTKYKGAGKETYGTAFKDIFERNRFRVSAFTVVTSAVVHVKELLEGSKHAWGATVDEVHIPKVEEFKVLLKDFDTFLYEKFDIHFDTLQSQQDIAKALNDRYHTLTVTEKLEYVDFFSSIARRYLAIVAVEKEDEEPIPQSPTSQDS